MIVDGNAARRRRRCEIQIREYTRGTDNNHRPTTTPTSTVQRHVISRETCRWISTERVNLDVRVTPHITHHLPFTPRTREVATLLLVGFTSEKRNSTSITASRLRQLLSTPRSQSSLGAPLRPRRALGTEKLASMAALGLHYLPVCRTRITARAKAAAALHRGQGRTG